ncbi:MAG: Tm-1-like ATP-binding domain-containing protein [Thermomicrobiales bacterium]
MLVGTLDTKGDEYEFVRRCLTEFGVDTLLIDAGILGPPRANPDISRAEVAQAAGLDLSTLVDGGDRGGAIDAMARGATAIVTRLHDEGRLDGIIGLGGSGGSTLIGAVMRALPVGVPKVLVSTVAIGDTRAYVGSADVMMLYPVVDIAGINRVSAQILTNAAAAIAGMAKARTSYRPLQTGRPLIAATMFGVTTPCVTVARERLEELGYEVLVFHATGAGGDAMEALVRSGLVQGVLDITTTELADTLAGGVCAAGPDRLAAAGEVGIPQVVSLGALDMVNFGPMETVPDRYAGRQFHRHNAAVTLMRTTAEECAELGRRIAERLNAARGPVRLFMPLRGVSMIATEDQPFHDPIADAALFDALRRYLEPKVELHAFDTDINDPAFARAMADALHACMGATAMGGTVGEDTRAHP